MLPIHIDMMYSIGTKPMEDEEYLTVLKVAEKYIEEKKRDKKKDYKPQKKDEKNKNKENRNKLKNQKNNEGNKVAKNGPEKKKRHYKFENVKEALKGRSEEIITKSKDA
jgi:hypothetical protein